MSEPTGTQYGGFWIRFLAYLVDSAILFLIAVLLFAGATTALGPEGFEPALWATMAVSILYWPLMHSAKRQATIGKGLLGLKVARLNGGRIGILRSFWREISKIVSGAVMMLGYIIAGFTPRKQALHDLMASTYVAREGVSRTVPALAIAVAGFTLPVFALPMVIGDAAVATLMQMAENMAAGQDPMRQPPKPAAKAAAPKPAAPKPAAPAPTQVAKAPAAEPKAEAPKPEAPKPEAPKAEAPKPEAPKPAPVAAAPKPVPVAKPEVKVEPKTEVKAEVKPEVKAEPKPAPAPAPAKVAARPTPPLPPFEPKVVEGPKYNDLMTAVLYRDADGLVELLKMGKWVEKPDSRGLTPLMVAVELGDGRSAEALLRAGADPHRAMPVAEERRDGQMMQLLKRYYAR